MRCFTAHTRIITRSGKKEIQDIEEGDEVPSADPYTGEISYKKVLKTTCQEADTLVLVSVNGETIETTETHPFWVEEHGFVPAYHLKQGDTLRLADGSNISVESVEIRHLDAPVLVYNFTVEDNHTYFVGDSGVWVHNATCLLEQYSKNGGHHIHSQAAMRNSVNYKGSKAPSISQAMMKKYNINHTKVTSAQRKLYNELARSGKPITWREETRIASEALKAGGANKTLAKRLAKESMRILKSQKVGAPTRIPWH